MSRDLAQAGGVVAKTAAAMWPVIVLIVDTSESMQQGNRRAAANRGIAKFLADQKRVQGPDAILVVVMFNEAWEVVYGPDLLANVPEITIKPRGMTAIRYSLVGALDGVWRWVFSRDPGRFPDEVIVVVVTDGEETVHNFHWGWELVRNFVANIRVRLGWKFAFFTISMAAANEATTQLGLSAAEVTVFEGSDEELERVFGEASNTVTGYTTRH